MLNIRDLRDRAAIRPIKRAVEDYLLDFPDVVAVDIGERSRSGRRTGEQVIVVSVRHKRSALPPGQLLPTDVLGIPIDVVEEQFVLHHQHHPLSPQRSDLPVPRRVTAGSGIAPCRPVLLCPPDVAAPGRFRRVGTLGAIVVGYNPRPVVMGLTTFDVACMDDAWAVGDRMIDPDVGGVFADLARAALSGRVDAAAVTLGVDTDFGCEVDGIGVVSGQCEAHLGETVRKVGIGTGLTEGRVLSTDATLRVDHGQSIGERVLREQIRVTAGSARRPFADRGDAGAALINGDGRVVGLHCAGSVDGRTGFACPISEVLAELDVQLYVPPPAPR